ncbi:MAG TPA: D-alanyl-D-alanine carboxypeptidase family protein [Rhizobiaceae bacterium]|nr:D-alanyl-D-alanine carboxypeptidase family protein [Rhizobiaceae bacterium]
MLMLATGAMLSSALARQSAAIMIDANTGKVLYESNADAFCYPASLTKMMTLYLTFEAMAEGRITKNTPVPFSSYASAQAPTKLGVKAGDSVPVEMAIDSIITRSANDSAAALGELLGGSTANFARMMNAKARSLGMSRTTFRNANGLPDPEQKTTARDMARLGIALREHFPQYYHYFSVEQFAFRGHVIRGHNHLLGKIPGVDGIKTGYTRASGFNLATSVAIGGKRLVGVVMGGRTHRERDHRMAALIHKYLPMASARRDSRELVADAAPASPRTQLATMDRGDIPTPDKRPHRQPQPSALALAEAAQSAGIQKINAVVDDVQTSSTETEAPAKEVDAKEDTAPAKNGWVIQVASTDSKTQAQAFLEKTVKEAPRVLADASPFTTTFEKHGNVYYRARFGGFSSKGKAWDACSALKKRKIACYAVAAE